MDQQPTAFIPHIFALQTWLCSEASIFQVLTLSPLPPLGSQKAIKDLGLVISAWNALGLLQNSMDARIQLSLKLRPHVNRHDLYFGREEFIASITERMILKGKVPIFNLALVA